MQQGRCGWWDTEKRACIVSIAPSRPSENKPQVFQMHCVFPVPVPGRVPIVVVFCGGVGDLCILVLYILGYYACSCLFLRAVELLEWPGRDYLVTFAWCRQTLTTEKAFGGGERTDNSDLVVRSRGTTGGSLWGVSEGSRDRKPEARIRLQLSYICCNP